MNKKMNSFFSLQAVTVSMGNQIILNDINTKVPDVSGVGLVGLSGSGKTTLLRSLLGLVPHLGKINVLGVQVSPKHDNIHLYRRLGVLFQQAALFNDLTIEANCMFAQELSRDPTIRPERIEVVLRRLNLWDARNLLPRQLSGGMKHRAGLARTLVRSTDCLMLDEPTTGQDAEHTTIIQELLLEYQQEQKGRLVIISHDYEWLKPLVQWSILVHEGRVAYEGPELMTMKATQEVAPC